MCMYLCAHTYICAPRCTHIMCFITNVLHVAQAVNKLLLLFIDSRLKVVASLPEEDNMGSIA